MPSLIASLAPVALLAAAGVAHDARWSNQPEALRFGPEQLDLELKPGSALRDSLVAEWPPKSPAANQVRIERQVTVRITPLTSRSTIERQSLMAEMPQAPRPTRYQERKIGKCVAVDDIAGVQTGSGDRLVLFLRDRRMVSARLEKACRARDFYSGFYLEQSKDGKLCIERDKLQSRAGANCEVDRLRELVPVND